MFPEEFDPEEEAIAQRKDAKLVAQQWIIDLLFAQMVQEGLDTKSILSRTRFCIHQTLANPLSSPNADDPIMSDHLSQLTEEIAEEILARLLMNAEYPEKLA